MENKKIRLVVISEEFLNRIQICENPLYNKPKTVDLNKVNFYPKDLKNRVENINDWSN